MRTYIYLLSLLAFFAFSENTDIEEILSENENNFSLSEKSQSQVNDLSTEKDSLLAEWKVVVKQVEGLKIYNEQKRRQIKAQAHFYKMVCSNWRTEFSDKFQP